MASTVKEMNQWDVVMEGSKAIKKFAAKGGKFDDTRLTDIGFPYRETVGTCVLYQDYETGVAFVDAGGTFEGASQYVAAANNPEFIELFAAHGGKFDQQLDNVGCSAGCWVLGSNVNSLRASRIKAFVKSGGKFTDDPYAALAAIKRSFEITEAYVEFGGGFDFLVGEDREQAAKHAITDPKKLKAFIEGGGKLITPEEKLALVGLLAPDAVDSVAARLMRKIKAQAKAKSSKATATDNAPLGLAMGQPRNRSMQAQA